jgi:RHS repeat-associated protein
VLLAFVPVVALWCAGASGFAACHAPCRANTRGESASGGAAAGGLLSGELVVPGVQTLDAGQQVLDAARAERASPEAVLAREESRTKYAGLRTGEAATVDGQTFPALVDEPVDGAPQVPAGVQITGYTSDKSARVDLADGKRGVIESTAPMAVASSSGGYVPLDLSLAEAGGAFEPKESSVGVRIPKNLSGGTRLGRSGVSLTPVDAHGASPPTAGRMVAGASVLYANALPDTDVVVKPTAQGFDEDALLRSVNSAQRLRFRVGLPQGANLVQSSPGSPIRVLDDGEALALILPPSAHDAAGTPVPASMKVSGDTVSVLVNAPAGTYQYPIAVDPTVVSAEIYGKGAPWEFGTDNTSGFSIYDPGEMWREGEERHASLLGVCLCGYGYTRGQFGAVLYTTKGESKIEHWHVETYSDVPTSVGNSEIVIANAHAESERLLLPKEQGWHEVSATIEPSQGNTAEYFVDITALSGTEAYVSGFYRSEITLQQEAPPHVSMNTTEATVEGKQNPLYENRWSSATSGSWAIASTGTDPGLGVQSSTSSSSSAAKWGSTVQGWCNGAQCHTPTTATFALKGSTESLPEGEDTVEVKVKDPVGLEAGTGPYKIKVDSAPPHNITLSGLTNGAELGGATTLKAEATDGSGSTPSSGVKSLAIAVDGHEIYAPAGSCSAPTGPCTATAEWPLSGGQFSTGEHKLKVTATDNAGNSAADEISFVVYRAAPVPVGPGSIQSQSGEFTLGSTDVSVGGAGVSLAVARSYGSRHLTAGSEGPLGPQWSLSVGGQESIARLANGSATLTASNGGQTTFTSNEKGSFVSPTGDASLSLSEVKNEKGELTEYILKDAADSSTTRFTSTSGPSGTLWKPAKQEGPLASQTARYVYQTVEGVTEPKYAVAPEPTGLSFSCISKLEKAEKLEKGCRILEFKYAEKTKESIGENEKEWGEYKGRLQRVLFEAYNPSSKKMEEPGKALAEYVYDKQGRLRAEWNPQISPALKVMYGYDPEGHVTALTEPAQESWAFTYGTMAGDLNTGRLLKVTQAPVSASLWNGESTVNTEVPKLSRQPVVGLRMSVSNGTWSNAPLAYGYQWEDCNATGKACTLIAGATNANYTPVESDLGHTLIAEVFATNGGGSAVAVSSYSKVLSAEMTEYSLSGGGYPRGIVTGSDKNLWFTKFSSSESKVGKITTSGTATEYTLPSASHPIGIAPGPDKNLWFTDEGTSKIGKITTTGTITEYALPTGSSPQGITAGPDGNLWFTDEGTSKIGKITTTGTITEYALPSGSRPLSIATGSDKNLWFVDFGTSKVGKITTTGTVTEYALPSGSYPDAITAGPDEKLWFTENQTDKIGKIATTGAITEYSLSFPGAPVAIATGSDKNIWFTVSNGKMGKITTSGAITEYSLPEGGIQFGITSGPDENVWYTNDAATGRVGKLNLKPTQGEAVAPQPGSTIEYHLPVSGTGLPTLTKSEVEKWGQKDDPTEGIAIFPPDKPQGWPASSYERATIDYLDSKGKTVNTVSPTGAISTTEYNTYGDVVRTLSPANRLTALKETCESKLKCKSAEVSKLLDTEHVYEESGSEPGTRLLETFGPQHTVKLAKGKEIADEEVLARKHTKYYYDEGAPPESGPYNLVTRSTEGAQKANKEEFDVRETKTSYSGQENLGWKLREATAVTTDPSGLNVTHTAVYDKETGEVVETRGPSGGPNAVYPSVFSSSFGGLGSGAGQFNEPCGIAFDSSGNVWVVDAQNGRVEKWSSAGSYIASYGTKGSGNVQFSRPYGIAINQSTGNVYVGDYGNNRVEELNSSGGYVTSLGTSGEGALSEPMGVALDSAGDIFVADRGHDRVVEFNPEGAYVRAFGSFGSGEGQLKEPMGLTVSEGSVYVADFGNNRIEQFSTGGAHLGQFGSAGSGAGQFKEPFAVAANPSTGVLYVADLGNQRIDELTPAGRFLTDWETWGPAHQFSRPVAVAVGATGKLYVSDLNAAKVSVWTSPEAGAAHLAYASQFGSSGSGAGQVSTPIDAAIDGQGNVWVSDLANDRIDEFASGGAFIKTVGWGVSNGKAELQVCTSSCRAGLSGSGNGQFNAPGGIDVNQSTGNVYVEDSARVQELSSAGAFIAVFGTEGAGKLTQPGSLKIDSSGNVWVPDMKADKIFEYSSSGAFIASYGKEGAGEAQFNKPIAVAPVGENLYIADSANHRVEEITNKGAYVRSFGTEGAGAGELYDPEGIAADTAGNLYVVDASANHVEEFNSTGGYLATFASAGTGEGQLKEPIGDAIDTAGNLYIVDEGNNRIEKWGQPLPRPHDTQVIYYSAGANGEYPQCGEHPEWAGLPCQTQPAKQPETSGLPKLPVTTYGSYNIFDEPETATEKVEATTRTATTTYDSAGRVTTSAISSTVGTASPVISDEYSSETGALIKLCANEGKPCSEGKPKTITSVYNKLGQLTSYTDASEATTKYEYEGEGSYKGEKELDRRLRHVDDGKGTETYKYSETSGLLIELVNEYGTTKLPFTATYDSEGKMLSEGYPNGMTASYTYNAVDTPTGLEYKKTTHCTEESGKCIWFKDSAVPSIYGQWLEQTSTLSHQAYTYDDLGRLTQVQNTPTGKGCTTRIYAYDEDTNRTSLTTREPNSKGECATEGGSEERHTYDEADRLTDSGTVYNTFGDITALPGKDAGGEELTSTYYTDNQLASQTQGGETIGYSLDPAGRTLETIATGKKVANTTLHYAGPSSAPAWTSNAAGETARNVTGINGQLAAIQNGTEAPELQIVNLHGDIVAKAYLSEIATELASKADTSEFGVPTTSLPSKYSWLGALELPAELPSGVIDMGARSYVPQLGRFLQPDPIPGGSANAYSYTFGDPVNSVDPSGESTESVLGLDAEWAAEAGAAALAKEEAEIAQRRAEEAAERAAEEALARWYAEGAATEAQWASWWGSYYASLSGGGEEEWEEWEEWEEEWEYAAYHRGAKPAQEEMHIESGVLFQPLIGETDDRRGGQASEGVGWGSGADSGSTMPPCKAGAEGPCVEDDAYYCSNDKCHGTGRYRGSQGHRVRRRRSTSGGTRPCEGAEGWACSPAERSNGDPDHISPYDYGGEVPEPGGHPAGAGGLEAGDGGAPVTYTPPKD